MIVVVACSTQDMSAEVLQFAKNWNIHGNVRMIAHTHLLPQYREKTKWFTKPLRPADYLRAERMFILLPGKDLSFKMLLWAMMLPFSKVVVLPDGNVFSAKNFGAWFYVLRHYTGIMGRFTLTSAIPVALAIGVVLIRLVLFRTVWELKKLRK